MMGSATFYSSTPASNVELSGIRFAGRSSHSVARFSIVDNFLPNDANLESSQSGKGLRK